MDTAVPHLGTRDSGTPNNQIKMKTQISKITALFLNYPKMLQVWNATEFVFLSDECVGFKVSTSTYKGAVIITWQDNALLLGPLPGYGTQDPGNLQCREDDVCSEGLC